MVRHNGRDWSDGVLTVVTEVSEDQKSVDVGFAFCSPKDRFSKKTGREIARKRLQSAPLRTKFTGHSADDVVRLFNLNKYAADLKPKLWKKGGFVLGSCGPI